MGFKTLWISFVLIALVVFALMSFIVQFQTDQGDSTILENTVFNKSYQALQTNLTSFSATAQGQKENFESDPPTVSFGALVVFAIVSSGQIFSGMIIALYNIFIVLPATFLGIPEIVISVLSAVLLVTIILVLWRLYKQGE